MPRISLDTNVLVYAVDPSARDKTSIARWILRETAEADGLLTQQVIGEFLNVSRRMAHLNQRRLRRIALGFCTTFPIVPTSRDNLFEAFDRSQRYNLQFWDALIVSVSLANAATHLLSEDMQDGANLDGLVVINPFKIENKPELDRLLAEH